MIGLSPPKASAQAPNDDDDGDDIISNTMKYTMKCEVHVCVCVGLSGWLFGCGIGLHVCAVVV